jgi:hypothetical protein
MGLRSNAVGHQKVADGTFAVLMLLIGLTDMGQNNCGTSAGCLARSHTTPQMAVSAGRVLKRRADPAPESYLRYDTGRHVGPFEKAVGLSVGEGGETWLGYGLTYNLPLGRTGLYAELHLMPGLYLPNGGFDLGGPMVFRSGIELGLETRTGWRFAWSYDHRSHAGIFGKNPGIETVQLKVAKPTQ